MAFEELDRWLEQWAQRQRRGIRETLAHELMALEAAAVRLRQADAADYPNLS